VAGDVAAPLKWAMITAVSDRPEQRMDMPESARSQFTTLWSSTPRGAAGLTNRLLILLLVACVACACLAPGTPARLAATDDGTATAVSSTFGAILLASEADSAYDRRDRCGEERDGSGCEAAMPGHFLHDVSRQVVVSLAVEESYFSECERRRMRTSGRHPPAPSTFGCCLYA
jgi:hypothetical protein